MTRTVQFLLSCCAVALMFSASAMAQCCVVPSSETTQNVGRNFYNMARFLQTVSTPTGASLNGRGIVEYTSMQGQNSCYWDGATLPQYPPVQGISWTVGVNGPNKWGPDEVGWGPEAIRYINQFAPQNGIPITEENGCGFVIFQGLAIECEATLFFSYVENNRLSEMVYCDHLEVCRRENMSPYGEACDSYIPYEL